MKKNYFILPVLSILFITCKEKNERATSPFQTKDVFDSTYVYEIMNEEPCQRVKLIEMNREAVVQGLGFSDTLLTNICDVTDCSIKLKIGGSFDPGPFHQDNLEVLDKKLKVWKQQLHCSF